MPRSGRDSSLLALTPLLLLLFVGGTAAVPFSAEKAYREARTAANLGKNAEAATKVDAALARAGNLDDEWVWALRVLKAELLAKNSQTETARQMLAAELPSKYRWTEAAVRRLLALGFATEGKQQIQYFEAALKLAEAKQPQLAWAAHLSLANLNSLDFKEAEAHLRKAAELAKRHGDRIGVVHASGTLQRRYTDVGRYREAAEAGEQVIAEYRAIGATGRIASASGNLGWTYAELGDWERARELFVQAEATAAQVGNGTERIKWIQQLGNAAFVQRNFVEAERLYLDALARARATNDPERASLLTNLARTCVETKRAAAAKRYITEALSLSKSDSTRIVEARVDMLGTDFARAEKTLREVASQAKGSVAWTAEAYLAQLYERTGRNAAAEAAYKRAIGTVSTIRKTIDNSELRLSFFNVAEEIFDGYVDFLMSNKRVQDALAAMELVRAETLEEGLRRGDASRKLDPRSIAKQRGATILAYSLGRERSWVWMITPNGLAHAQLPADTVIERAVQPYAKSMRDYRSSMQQSGAKAQELYQMLVAPAVSALPKNARVIVVPDGTLHALNFETLVVPGAQPRYWIEDVTLSYAGSLQLLGTPTPKKSGTASMLLVGDPPVADPTYPKLPFAKKELDAIAAQFAQRVLLTGANATPASYRAASPGKFDFVHFVAHGVATRQRPLDSAVILGRDATKQYKLFARDIVGQPLAARLVTISSCHGAGDRTFAGEGLVGLAWAFLGAGADEVIAALWEVNDSATPELMAKMYAGIRKGQEPAAALRDAKLSLVRGKGARTAPRYWAPFVLYSGG